jgi:hypothetical protein
VAGQQQLVVNEVMPPCLDVQQSDIVSDGQPAMSDWQVGHAVRVQQLSSN